MARFSLPALLIIKTMHLLPYFASAGTMSDWQDPCEESPVPTTQTLDLTHAAFTEVLSAHVQNDVTIAGVRSSVVDYAVLRKNPAPLRSYLRQLCIVDLDALSPAQRVALFCNAYNALMLAIIVHFDPPESVLDLSSEVPGGVIWKERFGTVAGNKVSLDDIEHSYVRDGLSAQVNGQGLVHACFVCASLSCPDIQQKAFQGATLIQDLEGAIQRWLANPTKNPGTDGSKLTLSQIFQWYGGDFAAQAGSIQAFVNKYTSWQVAADMPIDHISYSWALNAVNGTGTFSSSTASTSPLGVFSLLATAVAVQLLPS